MPASLAGSYNGLSFGGPFDEVHVNAMIGVRDLPRLESTHKPKVVANGLVRGEMRRRELEFSFVFGLIPNTRTATGFDALLETVLAAFEVQDTADLPLQFWGNTLYVYCSPIARKVPLDCTSPQVSGEVTVDFRACDPTVYTGTPPP